MQPKTKLLFAAMTVAMATTYGVTDVEKDFNVTPTVAQELNDAIVQSTEFLAKVNLMPVDELKGEKVLGGVNAGPGRRTDTETNKRTTRSVLNLGSKTYELHPTEFDYHLKYATVDSWAKFSDFEQRYQTWIRKAIALARIQVGWLGTSAAVETDPVTNTNGEDLNIGWLQLLRDYASGKQWFDGSTGTQVANQIRIGAGGDFENLDSAVHAAKQMINVVHRSGGDLVAIVGEDLVAEEKAALYKALGQKPTEKERIEADVVSKVYAGCPLETDVPFFPARGLLVTSLDNLSIYYQTDSWRRSVKDAPESNRTEDFNSVNEGYVIEDEEKAAGFEPANVRQPDGSGGWA